MILADEIKTWLEEGESERLEFKTSFNAECIETLVAFANAKGGSVLLGVSDNAEPIGVILSKESIGLIEKYGSGVKRVREQFVAFGLPEPEFQTMVDGMQVIVVGKKFNEVTDTSDKVTDEVIDTSDKVTDKVIDTNDKVTDTSDKVTDKVTDTNDKVTDNQHAIMRLISENKNISANEISGIIGISKRKVLQNTLKLKEKGLLERVGNNKTGYWKVKM